MRLRLVLRSQRNCKYYKNMKEMQVWAGRKQQFYREKIYHNSQRKYVFSA